MIRRWTHIHSLATGLTFGLVLDREALVIFALGIALGVIVVVGWRKLKAAGRFARSAGAELVGVRERLTEAEIERKLAAAAEARARAEHRVRTAGEQKVAERSAYWKGARDGGWLDDERERPTTILGVPVPVREEA